MVLKELVNIAKMTITLIVCLLTQKYVKDVKKSDSMQEFRRKVERLKKIKESKKILSRQIVTFEICFERFRKRNK